MSLADRLAAAQRDRTAPERTGGLDDAAPRPRRHVDPFAELKRTVHHALLDSLGPQLYDSKQTQSDVEQKVRQTLQEVLAQDHTPLTGNDRLASPRRSPTTSSATGRWSPTCATAT